jgi:hypothetical protein
LFVKFLGIRPHRKDETINYLHNYILGKNVILKFESSDVVDKETVRAYVYLKNKIFINAYLIKSGLAVPDLSYNYRYKDKFVKIWKETKDGKGMDIEHGYKQMGIK